MEATKLLNAEEAKKQEPSVEKGEKDKGKKHEEEENKQEEDETTNSPRVMQGEENKKTEIQTTLYIQDSVKCNNASLCISSTHSVPMSPISLSRNHFRYYSVC